VKIWGVAFANLVMEVFYGGFPHNLEYQYPRSSRKLTLFGVTNFLLLGSWFSFRNDWGTLLCIQATSFHWSRWSNVGYAGQDSVFYAKV
jgi:hypothetical protein